MIGPRLSHKTLDDGTSVAVPNTILTCLAVAKDFTQCPSRAPLTPGHPGYAFQRGLQGGSLQDCISGQDTEVTADSATESATEFMEMKHSSLPCFDGFAVAGSLFSLSGSPALTRPIEYTWMVPDMQKKRKSGDPPSEAEPRTKTRASFAALAAAKHAGGPLGTLSSLQDGTHGQVLPVKHVPLLSGDKPTTSSPRLGSSNGDVPEATGHGTHSPSPNEVHPAIPGLTTRRGTLLPAHRLAEPPSAPARSGSRSATDGNAKRPHDVASLSTTFSKEGETAQDAGGLYWAAHSAGDISNRADRGQGDATVMATSGAAGTESFAAMLLWLREAARDPLGSLFHVPRVAAAQPELATAGVAPAAVAAIPWEAVAAAGGGGDGETAGAAATAGVPGAAAPAETAEGPTTAVAAAATSAAVLLHAQVVVEQGEPAMGQSQLQQRNDGVNGVVACVAGELPSAPSSDARDASAPPHTLGAPPSLATTPGAAHHSASAIASPSGAAVVTLCPPLMSPGAPMMASPSPNGGDSIPPSEPVATDSNHSVGLAVRGTVTDIDNDSSSMNRTGFLGGGPGASPAGAAPPTAIAAQWPVPVDFPGSSMVVVPGQSTVVVPGQDAISGHEQGVVAVPGPSVIDEATISPQAAPRHLFETCIRPLIAFREAVYGGADSTVLPAGSSHRPRFLSLAARFLREMERAHMVGYLQGSDDDLDDLAGALGGKDKPGGAGAGTRADGRPARGCLRVSAGRSRVAIRIGPRAQVSIPPWQPPPRRPAPAANRSPLGEPPRRTRGASQDASPGASQGPSSSAGKQGARGRDVLMGGMGSSPLSSSPADAGVLRRPTRLSPAVDDMGRMPSPALQGGRGRDGRGGRKGEAVSAVSVLSAGSRGKLGTSEGLPSAGEGDGLDGSGAKCARVEGGGRVLSGTLAMRRIQLGRGSLMAGSHFFRLALLGMDPWQGRSGRSSQGGGHEGGEEGGDAKGEEGGADGDGLLSERQRAEREAELGSVCGVLDFAGLEGGAGEGGRGGGYGEPDRRAGRVIWRASSGAPLEGFPFRPPRVPVSQMIEEVRSAMRRASLALVNETGKAAKELGLLSVGERDKADWTDKELAAYIEGFQLHGRDFAKVARVVQSKSTARVVSYYYNVHKPQLITEKLLAKEAAALGSAGAPKGFPPPPPVRNRPAC
eukprot:jgi/Mesvir1/5312/Mv15406-RA.1